MQTLSRPVEPETSEHPLLVGLDRSLTKNEIRDILRDNVTRLGGFISTALADKSAKRYKQGKLDLMDPDLRRVLQYTDRTGEEAVENVMRETEQIICQ